MPKQAGQDGMPAQMLAQRDYSGFLLCHFRLLKVMIPLAGSYGFTCWKLWFRLLKVISSFVESYKMEKQFSLNY